MHASGEYIFLSDQDDLWDSHRVDKVLAVLKEKKRTLVLCDAKIIDGKGDYINKYIGYSSPLLHNFSTLRCALKGSPYIGCVMAFDRSLLCQLLPFPRVLNSHDFWIALNAIYNKRIQIIKEPLHLYRIHGANVSSNTYNSFVFKIIYRLYTLLSLWKCRLKLILS